MIAKIRELFSGRQRDKDMTEGNITRHLIIFALPLLIGNIFQQFYNMVDAWVVGNYVSNEAFSAVGTVGSVINMLIGFFTGLASGAGVVISQYYGAKRYDKVHDTVHTAIVMTLILGVLFTGIGILMVPFVVEIMKTPAEVVPESTTYLTIYFSGVIGMMIYNMGAGILRAIGDSGRPFCYLMVSAVTNIVLDLVFVLGFEMGVAGVAWATVISQALSAILVVIELLRTNECVKIRVKDLTIHWRILKMIVRVGFPAGFQMAITSFSNVFVQSYVNHFGADCMSGWTAYSKIDQIIFLPMQSLALASTTFVGQNLGVNNVERAKKGVSIALRMSIIVTVILVIPIQIFAPYLTSFFNNKPEVVVYGTILLRCNSLFYVLCCMNQIYAGALRGSGDGRTPMITMLVSFVLFRQIYLFVMANFISNEIIPIALGYPAGWLMCSILTSIAYHRAKLSRNRII